MARIVVILLAVIFLPSLVACEGASLATPMSAPTKATPANAAPAPTPAASAAVPEPAAALPTVASGSRVVEYNIAALTDYTGPNREPMKTIDPPRKVALAWWNETVGKAIGVRVKAKFYDTRNDSSVVASLWPGVLGEDKPIFALSSGGADTSGLQQRLSADKVALFSGSHPFGFNWVSDQWLFFAQPSATHLLSAVLDWQSGSKAPLRIAQLQSDRSAESKDDVSGLQSAINQGVFGGKVEYAGVEWVSTSAAYVSSEAKRLIDKKPDYIQFRLPVAPILSLIRVLQQYRVDDSIKVIFPFGLGIPVFARSVPLADLEGGLDQTGYVSELDTNVEAFRVFNEFKGLAGITDAWGTNTAWGMVSVLLPLRALERAVKAVGPDKVTGEAVYNAMYSGAFTGQEMLGMTGDLSFGKDAPFPIKGASVRVTTVKDGRYVVATPGRVPVPELSKW